MGELNPTLNDEELLLAAFRAAAEGTFFPDAEFPTLMGFTRDDLRALAARWPNVVDEELLDLAVTNVLANLLGYPHDSWNELRQFGIPESNGLEELLQHWRAGAYPLPHELVVHGKEPQPLDNLIETYFRDLGLLHETSEPGTDSTKALDEAGYDGGLFDWFVEAMYYGPPDGPEQAWPIILELVARAPDDHSLGIIGASAIEDLTHKHGTRFALRLIERTASEPRFRFAMRHVWFIDTPDWLQRRLKTLRGGPA